MFFPDEGKGRGEGTEGEGIILIHEKAPCVMVWKREGVVPLGIFRAHEDGEIKKALVEAVHDDFSVSAEEMGNDQRVLILQNFQCICHKGQRFAFPAAEGKIAAYCLLAKGTEFLLRDLSQAHDFLSPLPEEQSFAR